MEARVTGGVFCTAVTQTYVATGWVPSRQVKLSGALALALQTVPDYVHGLHRPAGIDFGAEMPVQCDRPCLDITLINLQ
jgi:hypothetical protein